MSFHVYFGSPSKPLNFSFSSPENLVWRFADFALERNQEVGVKIFMRKDPPSVEWDNKVLNLVQRYPKAHVSYLEHIVLERQSEESFEMFREDSKVLGGRKLTVFFRTLARKIPHATCVNLPRPYPDSGRRRLVAGEEGAGGQVPVVDRIVGLGEGELLALEVGKDRYASGESHLARKGTRVIVIQY